MTLNTSFVHIVYSSLLEHIVLFSQNTSFRLARTHRSIQLEHIVPFSQNTSFHLAGIHLFRLARTHRSVQLEYICSVQLEHIVSFSQNTLFHLAGTHCSIQLEYIVYSSLLSLGISYRKYFIRTHCVLIVARAHCSKYLVNFF